jgi:hypothetical protein
VGPSAGAGDGPAVVDFDAATDPGAGARSELELIGAMREESGMGALLAAAGAPAGTLATLDAVLADAGRRLVEETSTGIDSGSLLEPAAGRAGALTAAWTGDPGDAAAELALWPPPAAIDVSLFADTGFTASALLTLLTGVVQRADERGTGSLPRQESVDRTEGGVRQQVDLGTTFTVTTGGGKVSVDVTLTATARISDAASGSFIALLTSRSTGHFDLDACPDTAGVAAGTYTFETRQELDDVGGVAATRSTSGRSVEAPFRVINGDDARIVRIEAELDMDADAAGPGTPGGPGPTQPFDWQANQRAEVVMQPGGATTATAGTSTATGAGAPSAGSATFLTSAIAQLFLRQVAREAETFWRSGKCIDLVPSRDSGSVSSGEQVNLRVDAKQRFTGEAIEKPIVATFTGKASLEPSDTPVDAPATFTFTAGSDKDDRGTIDLKQTSNRGIGIRQVVYTVGEQDFKTDEQAAGASFRLKKCGGPVGSWTINVQAVYAIGDARGTYTFTIPRDSRTAPVRGDLVAKGGGITAHWVLSGSVTFVEATADSPPRLEFTPLNGTITIRAPGVTRTVSQVGQPFTVLLEAGTFCS